MSDSWCSPILYEGKKISGGAARNVLIKRSGGMDKLLDDVARDAARSALIRATYQVTPDAANDGNVVLLTRKAA